MPKEYFTIAGLGGAKVLRGALKVSGAKNAVLPAMASSLLFCDPLTLQNVPDIEDVTRTKELLTELGCSVVENEEGVCIDATSLARTELPEAIAKRLRASVIFTGPLLARSGKVTFPYPGGCVIGKRPIDLFLEGYAAMGASVEESADRYSITAPQGGLRGADIFFKVMSVTATEAFLMAAVLANGTSVLRNVAMEPEVVSLVEFLNSCGAKIRGAGTPVLEVEGGGLLAADGRPYVTIPDRIETGSFLVLGALAAEELEITHCNPEHVGIVTALLLEAGVPITVADDTIRITGNTKPNDTFKAFDIRTHEYPGFPTDLQAPMTVFLTQARGESAVFETIFEGRLNYTEDLVKMGAHIIIGNPYRVNIKGPTPLSGRELEGPDIRAGLAFIIAGIVASGTSQINNVYYVDRGYADIEERLKSIGVSIMRSSD